MDNAVVSRIIGLVCMVAGIVVIILALGSLILRIALGLIGLLLIQQGLFMYRTSQGQWHTRPWFYRFKHR